MTCMKLRLDLYDIYLPRRRHRPPWQLRRMPFTHGIVHNTKHHA
jgi:hypothetical protein